MECLRLRVCNLDFDQSWMDIFPVKEGKDRQIMIPGMIRQDLLDQVEAVRKTHTRDLATGYGQVDLSDIVKQSCNGMEKDFALSSPLDLL